MELWSEIRRRVLVEGVSRRQICREYGVGWRTLEKMLVFPEPPGYRVGVRRGRPRLGAFVGLIDGILADDLDPSTPRKQRHTARRIFERANRLARLTGLCAEHGVDHPSNVLACDPQAQSHVVKRQRVFVEREQALKQHVALRRRNLAAGSQSMFDGGWKPGLSLRGTANHDARGAGLPQRFTGICGATDVSIRENRNPYGIDDWCDRAPVSAVAEELLARAAVDSQHLNARVLGALGDVRSIQ